MQEQFLGPVFCLLTGQPKILKFRGEAYGTNALASLGEKACPIFPTSHRYGHSNT